MQFPSTYRILAKNEFSLGNFRLVPIRYEDRFLIMKWRNEQIYHLRQANPLTEENQENYFNSVVAKLFDQEKPGQLLFSFLKDQECIGYGGLVHINWIDKHAEISFVMNTSLEEAHFSEYWNTYLSLIEQAAFEQLDLHKIFTYAYDLRPHLFDAVEKANYTKEAVLKEHCLFNNEFKDVIIHSKIKQYGLNLRRVNDEDALLLFDWANDPEVRNNAFNSDPIDWENHLKWFRGKLNNENSRIYILLDQSIPVGQIRFDREKDNWLIDYSISSSNRGKGFGKKIVSLALEEFGPETRLIAKVKPENAASLQVFKSNGFDLFEQNDKIVVFSKVK
nr:GNAT family N-acetyltransferase [uncultured Fluviicola sp.]